MLKVARLPKKGRAGAFAGIPITPKGFPMSKLTLAPLAVLATVTLACNSDRTTAPDTPSFDATASIRFRCHKAGTGAPVFVNAGQANQLESEGYTCRPV